MTFAQNRIALQSVTFDLAKVLTAVIDQGRFQSLHCRVGSRPVLVAASALAVAVLEVRKTAQFLQSLVVVVLQIVLGVVLAAESPVHRIDAVL